ncbi:MAG: glutamine--fructose-6-phosphate transaminase (isomerizing) [Oscillospiraceae bacterium]|nr:glutamine--fructose-6-phosphate transaminase (isomerizing) [Clostridiales bacterium]MDD6936286.1 glutamine--fructose-6-phosphate transaminase (isomerizing) [Clostridiales bacterium]MDY2960852.1 glutamine--fructose-6-phosphate transaminase (isomerizing) [Oscillospiraceae bacterium]
MCGIVGYVGRQEAAPILLEGLKTLEYRGYDSAGVAVQKDGAIHMVKASGMIRNLCEKTHDGADLCGCIGIGHTRWATHGAPTDVNAHPHVSNDGKFAIVHNGIIENYLELREMLLAKGYVFHSETDTEVVVHLIDMYYDGNLKETVMRATARLEGSYVLGILCADEPDRLFVAKNGGPMILGVGAGENFFASDVTALVSHTKNVIYIDDGEFAELTADHLAVYDCTGQPIQKKISRVIWDIEAAEKGGYDHFMLKEIMEQPRALKATIEPRVRNDRIVFDELKLTDEQLRKINKIMITACGSAYYAGQAGKYVLEKLTKIPVETDLASEFRYRDPIVDEHTLMIIISQSGETADTIAAMKEAKSKGAHVLAIVNVVGSTIAKLADDVIYTWAGPEIAVATTKGYTTQVSVLYLLAVYVAEKLGRLSREEAAKLTDDITMLPQQIQRAIDLNPQIAQLAERYKKNPSLFFIGRNVDYAVCLEGSLKLKEISYLHSEAYAAGELKHGTIALIDEGRLVICLACYEPLFDKTMSNVKEVKARGARVLGVALEGNRAIYTEADDVIVVPRTNPLFNVPAEIVPLQLFAYYVAKANGCSIDKPKNLAKSVTVE